MKKIDVCVGTDRARNIRVRLSLMVVDDDTGDVLSEQYHSGELHPGDDPAALRASWDNHLSQRGGGIPGAPWPAIPDAEWNEVLAIVRVLHTQQRRQAWAQIKAANAAALQAKQGD